MPKRYFVTYTLAGSAIFCFALAYVGERLGHNLYLVLPLIHRFSLVIAAAIVVALVMVLWLRMARR
jgi:membrane protein DedA with SNARE-associated domain